MTSLAEIPLVSALLVAAAAFFGSLASGLTGSGGAIIVSFALAPIIGLTALVPTVSVAMAVSHVARVGAFRATSTARRRARARRGPAGRLIGALVYARLDERAIALTLGIFMLAIVALRRLRPAAPLRWDGLDPRALLRLRPRLRRHDRRRHPRAADPRSGGARRTALVATDAVIGLRSMA